MSAADKIAELEHELMAAKRTIEVLVARAESNAGVIKSRSGELDSALVLAQALDEREREVAEARTHLAEAKAEFRALTSNLDQIVRERTRALAASEAQLRQKMRELQQQSSLKAEFISIVAHELRTPLTSIVGYLDLVFEQRFGAVPATLERPLATVRRNGHRLKRLVDEMLDVTRLEDGRMVLTRSVVDLADVARDVATELAPLAQARRQQIFTIVGEASPLLCDRDKLYQIVVNLVSNAIRYGKEAGEIKITVDDAPADKYPGGWGRLRVYDNGVGIEEANRAKLFEPFYDQQPAKHHSSALPGSSGLGLYIARGLIELHGGLITVDSEVGKFTEFTVLLPHQEELPSSALSAPD